MYAVLKKQVFDVYVNYSRFKEVIGLGKQLLATNPALTDVADRIKNLENEQKAISKGQCFNRTFFKRKLFSIQLALAMLSLSTIFSLKR